MPQLTACCNLRLDTAITLFSNIIALTPGTLSLDFTSDRKSFFVHVMIIEAAYCDGVPLWSGTKIDELRSHYHLCTHELDSEVVKVDDQLPTLTVLREGDDFQQED